MLLRIVLMLMALFFGGSGQTIADGLNPNSAIYIQVKALDAKAFDAYNSCDLATLADMVDDNLEFYHDKTGLSRGRAAFIAAIRNNICGKVHRDLVAGSLEVYPLHGYGAVEIGAHVFCDPRQTAVCDAARSGVAKFVMLWQNAGGTWTLTRVISYDHVSDWQREKKP